MNHLPLPLACFAVLLAASVPAAAQQVTASTAPDTWTLVPAANASDAVAWRASAPATPPASSDTSTAGSHFKFKKIGPQPMQPPHPASREVGKPMGPPGRDGDPPLNCAFTPIDPKCR